MDGLRGEERRGAVEKVVGGAGGFVVRERLGFLSLRTWEFSVEVSSSLIRGLMHWVFVLQRDRMPTVASAAYFAAADPVVLYTSRTLRSCD